MALGWGTERGLESHAVSATYEAGFTPPSHSTTPSCLCLSNQAEVPLLVPDILVCSVGTEILFQGEI